MAEKRCIDCKYRSGDIEKPCDECVAGSRWAADPNVHCRNCIYIGRTSTEAPCDECYYHSNFEPEDKSDVVNHPAHYEGNTSLECIDVMEIAFGQEAVAKFCLCNAFKYLWRHKHKGGAEDVQKAEWYLNHFESIMGEYSDVEDSYNKMRELVHKALGETR